MANKNMPGKSIQKLKMAKFKKNIYRYIIEAMRVFHLKDWEVDVKFVDDMEDKDTAAVTTTFPEYMTAEIIVNLSFCLQMDQVKLRLTFFHEAAHMLVAELACLAESRWVTEDQMLKAEERLCQILSHIGAGK